jgi:hypothetical protein
MNIGGFFGWGWGRVQKKGMNGGYKYDHSTLYACLKVE